MEPETRYTAIGASVLALVIAATLAFVWLSNAGQTSDFRFYTIYFERQSLEGLQVGGDVNMRGVKVGRVERYTLSPDNVNRVEVRIRVAREAPVSMNTAAVVARNLVTGLARINLETPGTPGPPLVAVTADERDPVIAEGTSNIDQIADALGRLTVQADTALSNLNRLMGSENQTAFAETLSAVRDLAAGLGQRLEQLDRIAVGVEGTANALQQTSSEVARQVGPLAKDASEALREAQASIQTFNRVAQNLETRLSEALGRIERDTGGLARRTDETLDIGLHELRATTEALRASVDVITRTADRLQDPKALLLGPSERQLGPGETKR